MAEPEAAVPQAPRRATGEIPRSWAMPAEAVSDAPAPTSSHTVIVGVIAAAAAVALVVAAGTLGGRASTTTPPAPAVAPSTSTSPRAAIAPTMTTTPAPPASAPAPPSPTPPSPTPPATPTPTPPTPEPTAVAPEATPPAAADAVTPTRLRARAMIGKARLAARDGERDKALALAEQAVALDAGCGGCWRTLALLRRQTGDKAGAAEARARADAATDTLP